MRFLSDQDVYKITIDMLKEMGHDVITAKELGMQRASDEDLLKFAREDDRLLITRDKDFGALLFLKEEISAGVILLRGTPKTIGKLHHQLQKLVMDQSEDELKRAFSVVEPDRYRIRHL